MRILYLILSIFYLSVLLNLNSNINANSEINPEHLKSLKLKIVQNNGQKQTVDLNNINNPCLTVRPSQNTAQFKSHNPNVQMAYELNFKDSLNLIHSLYLDDKGNVIIKDAALTSTWSIKTTGTLIFKGNNNFNTLNTKSSAFINEGLFKAINGNHRHNSYINYGVMHFTNQTAQTSFEDYQQVYGDYLRSNHPQSSPLNYTLQNFGVLLTDNGIKFSNINQINHGLTMLRNAHIEQGSIENHKDYFLQGAFTGKVEDIVNHGWLYADKIDSLLTPDITQNKLIIQRWINRGGVFLGSDSNVIGAQEFNNNIWQENLTNNIYSLGSLLAGSYRYAQTMGSMSAENTIRILYEKLSYAEIFDRFSKKSKYYTPLGYINIECCEPVNEFGPIYKAPKLNAPHPDSRVNSLSRGKSNPPIYVDSHKAKHQALINLYNTLTARLVKLGVEQGAAKVAANNNIYKTPQAPVDTQPNHIKANPFQRNTNSPTYSAYMPMNYDSYSEATSAQTLRFSSQNPDETAIAGNSNMDAAPANAHWKDRGVDTYQGKVRAFVTPQGPRVPVNYPGIDPDEAANHNRRVNQETFDFRPDDYDTDIFIGEKYGSVNDIPFKDYKTLPEKILRQAINILPADFEMEPTREKRTNTIGVRFSWKKRETENYIRINDGKLKGYSAQQQPYLVATLHGKVRDQYGNVIETFIEKESVIIRNQYTGEIVKKIYTDRAPSHMEEAHIPLLDKNSNLTYLETLVDIMEKKPIKLPSLRELKQHERGKLK